MFSWRTVVIRPLMAGLVVGSLLYTTSAVAYEPNDTCAAATVVNLGVSGTVSTFSGNTCNATHNTLSRCRQYASPDVFYKFTVTQRSLVYVDAFGSNFDTVLFFTNTCDTTQAEGFDCVDDQCGTVQSQMVQVFEPGTYYLVVSGYYGQCGAFTVNFQHVPASDILRALPGSSQVAGSTDNTADRGNSRVTDRVLPSCIGSPGGRDVTYYYTTCPSYTGGAVSANTCGLASWDTVVSFRQGNTTNVSCNDDACGLQSSISATATSGAGLHALYVDGYNAYHFGDYTFNLTRP